MAAYYSDVKMFFGQVTYPGYVYIPLNIDNIPDAGVLATTSSAMHSMGDDPPGP